MNLRSELPFWTVRDGLLGVYPPLAEDQRCDVVVVGGGITGALTAHALVEAGVETVLIDRRDVGFGSTSTSTALLTTAGGSCSPRLETGFAWAGVFGHTRDGLAYIGPHPSFPGGLFALGFGGNGITFAANASLILRDLVLGRPNPDAGIFRFDR